MKKIFISISVFAITLANAQQKNETLMKEFESKRIEKNKKFDAYVAKLYGRNKNPETLKEIEKQRASLAGFIFEIPYFLKEQDTKQLSNANSDYLNTAGNIAGLAGAFNGENIKFTVFDGGRIYAAHDSFNNIANRITNKEDANTVPYSGHATGVGSFIGGKNANLTANGISAGNAKGVAINSKMDSYYFNDTILPGTTGPSDIFQKIIIANPEISNHSYGIETGWIEELDSNYNVVSYKYNGSKFGNTFFDFQGTYNANDYNYDQIVYSNPSYIIVKAAGNSFGTGPNGSTDNVPKYYNSNTGYVQFSPTDILPPNNCSQGYDCIGTGSLAKNIIVVGATDIINTNNFRYTAATDVIHSDYSSAGPRDDGGIKPDISTVGTNVLYAATSPAGSNAWAKGSGTSFSAPVVTGIIGLWTQINKQLFDNTILKASSAKVLTIHSASEAGNIGPDPHFGWGFINAKKGAELLVGKSNGSVIFTDEILTSGIEKTKLVKASGSEPLKVTISWIDPQYEYREETLDDVFNNRTSTLVNDIDLRIIDTTDNTVYYPWKLNANSPMTPATKGDNTVDNVEQVVINTPVSGRTYKIQITNKGTLVNDNSIASPQEYSIMITGHNEVLSTNDISNSVKNEFTVAPSVTKDVTNILKAPKKSTFTVYDMSGKKLQSGTINSEKEIIDLSTYTKGIYIIEIKTDKDIITKKVIKE